MASLLIQSAFVCRQCLRTSRRAKTHGIAFYSSGPTDPTSTGGITTDKAENDRSEDDSAGSNKAPEPGPMARRLEEATEEALFTGGSAGRRAVEDAGFSEELKAKLLDKIADAKFKQQYSGAFAEVGLPSSAAEGTRHIATAQAWTGEEKTEDAVLRMLDDARKPLKPGMRGKFQPPPVDMRLNREPTRTPGQRVGAAREKAALYTGMGLKNERGLSDEEKEAMRKEFKDRFQPAARAMPNTLSGLTALANERIEEAIARGQFKNLPRGVKMERDPGADNPFIDTTEFLMNRIIQRQDIVPPWIEKQQELAKTARIFRARLRNDWKRHVSRMIASKGGSLLDQIKRAEDHAAAEELHNPRRTNVDQIPVPTTATHDPVMANMRLQGQQDGGATDLAPKPDVESPPLLARPFRDAEWEQAERSYMNLAVDNLNKITRSYNLMAPDLAKKPYFSLQRELAACYADVAPLVAAEIQERATRPRSTGFGSGLVQEKKGGIMQKFGRKEDVRIYGETNANAYGLKEWWRDIWKKG